MVEKEIFRFAKQTITKYYQLHLERQGEEPRR